MKFPEIDWFVFLLLTILSVVPLSLVIVFLLTFNKIVL